MFYEEKTINGILHWRNTREGQWYAFTQEQLTEQLFTARQNVPQTKGTFKRTL